jgi:hypothetical protein
MPIVTRDGIPLWVDQIVFDQVYYADFQHIETAIAAGRADHFWRDIFLDEIKPLKPKIKLNLPDWW